MKHFVRILVTVLILGLLGGGVWYFFFKEDPDQVVFNRLTEAKVHMDDEIYITSKDNIRIYGYDGIMNLVNDSEISECTQYKYSTNKTLTDNSGELKVLRDNIFVVIEGYDDISMDGINYYYSLSASAKDVKRAERDNVETLIDNFNNKVDNVVKAVKDVIYFHDIKIVTNSSPTIANDQGYKDIVNKTYKLYEAVLEKQEAQNELFFELRNYVNTNVFGEFVPDHKATAYNVYTHQLNMLIAELKTKTITDMCSANYSSDLKSETDALKGIINRFESNTNGYFAKSCSAEYLDAYKNLEENGVLLDVLELTPTKKDTLALENYDAGSDEYINQDLYNSLNLGELKESQTTYPSIADNAEYFSTEQRDLLLSYVKDGQNYAAVGLTDAEFTSVELKAIINGQDPTLVSSFTDEVIYKTLRTLFTDNAKTLDNKMANDAETYGIGKDYLIDAQNLIKYLYN